jgi:hypothetical protein
MTTNLTSSYNNDIHSHSHRAAGAFGTLSKNCKEDWRVFETFAMRDQAVTGVQLKLVVRRFFLPKFIPRHQTLGILSRFCKICLWFVPMTTQKKPTTKHHEQALYKPNFRFFYGRLSISTF